MTLTRSLTVLLPVRDAQSTLAATVAEVLEMASDLNERFEVVIIDDGSTDATSEVAWELTRHYPQVRTLRSKRPMGQESALRAGLAQSRGDVVFVRDGRHPTFERLSYSSQPVRPNYLNRARNFARRVVVLLARNRLERFFRFCLPTLGLEGIMEVEGEHS